MSWGEILFGFHGRINRRTFWSGWILVSVGGLLLIALLADLATGDPVSPDIWRAPPGKESVWVPVWLSWLAFLAWPLSALAIKRLNDRERPAWLWYAYYGITILFSLPPLKNMTGADLGAVGSALMMALLMFGIYVFFELAVLRGTPGANAHGDDTLPAGYYGGDWDFMSLMLACEGRISRAKWWYGILIVISVITGATIAMTLVIDAYAAFYPDLEKNLSNPAWISSPEAAPIIFKLGLWAILPVVALLLAAWSCLALSVKRLHDRGLSTWMILVVVLPLLGAIVLPGAAGENAVHLVLLLLMASLIWSVLQFGILQGEIGPNQHGPDPLAGRN
jgi:uncharacterized membrane protein YhaH (DUF805 family)